jgi:hypothetical protein
MAQQQPGHGYEPGGGVGGKAESGGGGWAVVATGTNFGVKRLLFIAGRILFLRGSLS